MTVADPGWKVAARVALQIALLKKVETTLLVALRGVTIFAVGATVLLLPTAFLATAGTEPSTDSTAGVVLAAVIAVAGGLSGVLALRPPDSTTILRLAASLFRTTMLRVILGALVGGAGLVAAFVSGHPAFGAIGVVASVALIALAAPTSGRVDAWQSVLDKQNAGLSVREALAIEYKRR